MAHTVSTHSVDDVDGSPASQTVVFGIDRKRFEIDLSDANAATLRDLLAPYIAAGRRARPARHEGKGAGAIAPAQRRSATSGGRTGPPAAHADSTSPAASTRPAATAQAGTSEAGLAQVVAMRRPARPDSATQVNTLIADITRLLRDLAAAAIAAVAERIVALLLRLLDIVAPPDRAASDGAVQSRSAQRRASLMPVG